MRKSEDKNPQQIISKLEPLFNKPNLRLKFLGVVTMMGLHDDNPEEEIEVESQIMIYKVDCEGFLLDEQSRYILNQEGNQIRLSSSQIRSLEEFKMFRWAGYFPLRWSLSRNIFLFLKYDIDIL